MGKGDTFAKYSCSMTINTFKIAFCFWDFYVWMTSSFSCRQWRHTYNNKVSSYSVDEQLRVVVTFMTTGQNAFLDFGVSWREVSFGILRNYFSEIFQNCLITSIGLYSFITIFATLIGFLGHSSDRKFEFLGHSSDGKKKLKMVFSY